MQEKLVNLRKVFSVRQQELADYLGITLKTYRNKEQGKSQFTSDEMFSLSKYFKKPLEDIFLPTTYQNGKLKQEKLTNVASENISLPN
jgi:putative transcriptional regulator